MSRRIDGVDAPTLVILLSPPSRRGVVQHHRRGGARWRRSLGTWGSREEVAR